MKISGPPFEGRAYTLNAGITDGSSVRITAAASVELTGGVTYAPGITIPRSTESRSEASVVDIAGALSAAQISKLPVTSPSNDAIAPILCGPITRTPPV